MGNSNRFCWSIPMKPTANSPFPGFRRLRLSDAGKMQNFPIMYFKCCQEKSRRFLYFTFHIQVNIQKAIRTFLNRIDPLLKSSLTFFGQSSPNKRATLDIICQTAMGTCVEAQSDPDNQYLKDVCQITEITSMRAVRKNFHQK